MAEWTRDAPCPLLVVRPKEKTEGTAERKASRAAG